MALEKEVVDVEVNYFYLKMKNGKYNLYRRSVVVPPKIVTLLISELDSLEDAVAVTGELNKEENKDAELEQVKI